MKIIFHSDLHLDYNKRKIDNAEERYINFINDLDFDILVINGDIASSYKVTKRVIQKIKNLGKKVFFVPGNHDLYDSNSQKALEKLILMEECLINKYIELNENTVLLGGFSWYDYSFNKTDLNNEEIIDFKKNNWSDSVKINWEKNDIDISNLYISSIEKVIDEIKDKRILFFNHFVPNEYFLEFKLDDEKWNINNNFMGSNKILKVVNKYNNLDYFHFGHTHKRFGSKKINNIEFLCSPLGYFMEWDDLDFEKQLKESLIEINI